MDAERLKRLKEFIEQNKGKRKFTQSVDMVINFSGIDFAKQDNRLNLEINLPNGFGKLTQPIVFTDDVNLAKRSEALGAKIIPSSEIQTIANDKIRLNELLNTRLMAQPSLMPQIARALGQFLGPKGKMPKPLVGGSDMEAMLKDAGSMVNIRSKGKYLPTVHCTVGNEKLEAEKIAENIDRILVDVYKKAGKQNVRSVYLKLTMSPTMKLF